MAKLALDKSKRSDGDDDDDDSEEEDDDLLAGVNAMEVINKDIPPFKKGQAQITALSSLSLVARC